MKCNTAIFLALLPLLAAACHGNAPTEPAADTVATPQEEVQISFPGFTDTVVLDVHPAPARHLKPAPASKPKAAAPKPKAEKIYVETEGAQGRVWGHVTMTGDKGTGTIHDWDENTLSVSVTRHGNELYAVDQNSRQYIFRLK